MSSQPPSSPKTPLKKRISWKHHGSPSYVGSPGCCSTPSTSKTRSSSSPVQKVLWDENSPSKQSKVLGSPISKQSFLCEESRPRKTSQSVSKENETDLSLNCSMQGSSMDPSWGVKTYSSTESNGTVTVELDFPYGGWNEEDKSSDASSTHSLEIVVSEVECTSSPLRRGRKRKQSEVSEEDTAILSGMGEEIERQLEAKAERNRLTVPNVKNILRSVITNPYVQAMVRRSIKSGDVAVSGDTDDMSFEPRMTRAKAKLLCDNSDPSLSEVAWAATPHKSQPPSECQALINEELNDDSEDDEEYQPGEEEPSDNEYSEREGSERGSERDISMEQSPAFVDNDTESFPATPSPSPKLHIIDCGTQTSWSEDGVFKVPSVPPEPSLDPVIEENIALRTRSKLPLNDTPLEEIEQAFIPPDITPDLYDTTCDNVDWQEFLKEFMQPMRSEVETQNHEDDEEDPEYNVLAEEEIIDKEELRMDRAVKVSKRELNELMRELLEFTENMSSDDEDKTGHVDKSASTSILPPGLSNSSDVLGNNEEMSLFLDAYMSYGTLAPLKTTPPPGRSPSTPTLHTPIPPISPPCVKTPGTGKKGVCEELSSCNNMNYNGGESSYIGKGKSMYTSSEKKQTPGKVHSFQNSYGGKPEVLKTPGKLTSYTNSRSCSESVKKHHTPGKPDSFLKAVDSSRSGKKLRNVPGQLDNCLSSNGCSQTVSVEHTVGKLENFNVAVNSGLHCDDLGNAGLIGVNVAEPAAGCSHSGEQLFSPGKEYFLLGSNWEKNGANVSDPDETNVLEFQNSDHRIWSNCNDQQDSVLTHAEKSRDDSLTSDPELSASLPVSCSPNGEDSESESINIGGEVHLTSHGDVEIDGVVVLSAAQRLVLNQQMRQFVQITTQHFLQSYQHPVHGHYAEVCRKSLVFLDLKAKNKEKSAFRPANLAPALGIVNQWMEKLSSSEGPEILSFFEKQVSKAKHLKSRKQTLKEELCPQLLNLMSNSSAFIYPKLLPHFPFRTIKLGINFMLPSEEHLLAIGLEEFTEFIIANNPDCKGRCLHWAMDHVCEFLLVGRDPRKLCNLVRKRKFEKQPDPITFYLEHKHAPPTSHIVIPFQEEKMITLRKQPCYLLPPMWRNFLYPASD